MTCGCTIYTDERGRLLMRRVCLACACCEQHCKCEEPMLAESFVEGLAAMRRRVA